MPLQAKNPKTRMRPPRAERGTECPGMATGFPSLSNRPILGPISTHPTKAQTAKKKIAGILNGVDRIRIKLSFVERTKTCFLSRDLSMVLRLWKRKLMSLLLPTNGRTRWFENQLYFIPNLPQAPGNTDQKIWIRKRNSRKRFPKWSKENIFHC